MVLQRLQADSSIVYDLKTNLANLFTKKHFTEIELYTCMLGIATNYKDKELMEVISRELLNLGKSPSFIAETKRSVAMVTMLNYYYKMRFSMPDNDVYGLVDLSMQSLMGPKISRKLFQMMGFCLTGINGGSFRMPAHEIMLRQEDLTDDQIHDLIKLTAITSAICKLEVV